MFNFLKRMFIKNFIPPYRESEYECEFNHRWFYFSSDLDMADFGFDGIGVGYFEERICEKCFIQHSRQYKEKPRTGDDGWRWMGYGERVYKELVAEKLKYFKNPVGRQKNGRYDFIINGYSDTSRRKEMGLMRKKAMMEISGKCKDKTLLQKEMAEAIEQENYEKAAKLKKLL